MKKIITLLAVCFLSVANIKAQYVNIPDANFKAFLQSKYPTAFNGAGQMDTTNSLIVGEINFDCSSNNIASIDGIEYFKNLINFQCSLNQIKKIKALPSSIKTIDCYQNILDSLPALPSVLQYLNCSVNSIKSLPNLPNTLTYLNCAGNLLTSLPNLPNTLTQLWCPNNKLSNLPVLPISLGLLYCSDNLLTSLPFLPNTVGSIYCSNNLLTSISNLPTSLGYAEFVNNKLTSLPTLPANLGWFNCSNNLITSIPNIPNSMYWMQCGNNKLTSLPALPSNIYNLSCDTNLLTHLPTLPDTIILLSCTHNNLQCLPKLPNTLKNLCIDTFKIKCLPNFVTGLTVYDTAPYWYSISGITNYSICNASNNPNNCQTYSSTFINMVNIPDTSFGKFLLAQYPSCLYKDASNLYWMDTTCSDVVGATNMYCHNYTGINQIQNLEGIQYFKNLLVFYGGGNLINNIPALPNSLRNFECSYNQLTNLPPLPDKLEILNCSHNQLTSLPILPSKFIILDCSHNQLTNLPALPALIRGLDCNSNLLTSLPSLPNGYMDSIICYGNNIYCLPRLPDTVRNLGLDSSKIHCLPNSPKIIYQVLNFSTGYWASPISLPVCNNTNNPNNCPVFNPYVNIPDTSFGKFLLAQYPSCLYKDASNLYWMDTTCSGVVNEDSIICVGKSIADLNGVQYFKNLESLNCSSNKLLQLPTLPSSLKWLICYENQLSSLPSLPGSLEFLECSVNQLVSLPSLPNTLTSLACGSNKMKQLPSLPGSLEFLHCSVNQLDSLPTLPNTLQALFCDSNFIVKLPLLPNTLQTLNCNSNQILSLPVLPNSISDLFCSRNNLTNLPTLPSNISVLFCSSNKLSTLPDLPNSLTELFCSDNNIYCLPKLPDNLFLIGVDMGTKINCLPNLPINLGYSFPVCNPTNNINQCKSFPTIVGRVFTDNNSNGIKDANEFYRPFVKQLASNGDATFSNLNGAFAFSFDSTGSYSLKTIAPKYFKAVPDSNSFSFANNNVYLAVPDIALQPTTVKDSLAIVVTPLNSRARPGFSFPYHLGYANAGTTNLYTTVSFIYDTSRLVYDSSSVAIISHTNNTIVISTDSLVAGQGKYAQLYFRVKPTAVIGDSLFAVANAVSNATTATNGNVTIITGSFDPNDKVATPQLTPTQVTNGEWIEYTIRFQNTGNDTAINVVLADTLSSLLQPGYFNVISTSHLANLSYSFNNNIVYFEFLNIYLPDSATNYSGSQGWITFKVKPLAAVAVGTYIDNKASIYFDYNKPIVTNLARTLISTIVPVKLLSYELRLVNEATRNEKRVTNIWATANEINASHFNVQRSIDGVNFKTVGQVAAKGNGVYSFIDPLTNYHLPSSIFYRLQMVDKDGRFEYSPIREINLQPTISNIRLYPNPAKEIVTVECANAKEILITDYFGRTKHKAIINNQLSIINVQGFAKGIYLVQVVLDNGSIKTEKLIVE
ncbi:MAG: DUF7619 domain-containing protein [Chitinophagaceae bacterium]